MIGVATPLGKGAVRWTLTVAHLFAVRNAVDPQEAYRDFRGRDARIAALMRDRGFPEP